MAMTVFRAITLRGNEVTEGIEVADGQVPFTPRWGMTRHDPDAIAASTVPEGLLQYVHVSRTDSGVVLTPAHDCTASRELVLVQQYSPGTGAKRWPSFGVRLDDSVRKLSEAHTSGGSGSESWLLVTAPLGWASKIASRFVNERDYDDQMIAYEATD